MRVMRLLVMFDLPTGSKAERRSYAEFRKFLVKDGYHMEQFSIYSRLLLTRESSAAHVERLRCNLPPRRRRDRSRAHREAVLKQTQASQHQSPDLVPRRARRPAHPGPLSGGPKWHGDPFQLATEGSLVSGRCPMVVP